MSWQVIETLPAHLRPFVVNRRVTGAYQIYIGRPSIWANPSKLVTARGVAPEDREQAIRDFINHLRSHPELVDRARNELRGKVLGCWCAPAICHGDILVRIANP